MPLAPLRAQTTLRPLNETSLAALGSRLEFTPQVRAVPMLLAAKPGRRIAPDIRRIACTRRQSFGKPATQRSQFAALLAVDNSLATGVGAADHDRSGQERTRAVGPGPSADCYAFADTRA